MADANGPERKDQTKMTNSVAETQELKDKNPGHYCSAYYCAEVATATKTQNSLGCSHGTHEYPVCSFHVSHYAILATPCRLG